MKCREVGMDCGFVAHGKSEDQIMAEAAEPARKDHGMESIHEDVVAKVKTTNHEA